MPEIERKDPADQDWLGDPPDEAGPDPDVSPAARRQGLAHERALLRRMTALRFGADTAERLEEVLAGIADPERLAEAGEWLVRCETGDELLARVEEVRRRTNGCGSSAG